MSDQGLTWLAARFAQGPLLNDDLLHTLIPLLEQTASCHEIGLVAPLAGLTALKVADEQLYFIQADACQPKKIGRPLQLIDPISKAGITVQEEYRIDETDNNQQDNLLIGKAGALIKKPVFLTGWVTWEHEKGHHDALTDILSCGLLAVALATGLDLNHEEELEKLVTHRHNLFHFNPKLHPVIARIIIEMIAISRHQRLQDLPAAIDSLKNYRQQNITPPAQDFVTDLASQTSDQRQQILLRLRERLFDISRRNRLLYFKSTLSMVGMTEASIPLRLDPKRIKPDSLFTWQGRLAKRLSRGKPLALNEVLRFEDAPYLTGLLDRLRSADRKHKNEVGFSMLRLVVLFLDWHNLKDNREEKISSPLLLLPVALEKKKGVRDAYLLTPLSEDAEVNPVLRHHLQQLYDLTLPERVALDRFDLNDFQQQLATKIHASEPGIELRLVDKPAIDIIHTRAKKRVEVYQRRTRLTGRGIRRLDDIDYSYSRNNYQPLGLQLYLRRVRAQDWPLSHLTTSTPRPRMPMMIKGEEAVQTSSRYHLHQADDSNPYSWSLDSCRLVLGHFNYKKMSLLRDYEQLLAQPALTTPIFEELFNPAPKKHAPLNTHVSSWRHRFDVVSADPTQAQAVAAARQGEAFIIQGPPGTGKSQTITNLIADTVAQQKRVLFVCEKRAALDVVQHRLQQKGLDRLSCLIHDIQEDKKGFIANAKQTYEYFLSQDDDYDDQKRERHRTAKAINHHINTLDQWGEALTTTMEKQGISGLAAIHRLLPLEAQLPSAARRKQVPLPTWAAWQSASGPLRAVEAGLKALGETACLGQHPLRLLRQQCLLTDQVIPTIQAEIPRILENLHCCENALAPLTDHLSQPLSLQDWQLLLAYGHEIADLCEAGLVKLLHPKATALTTIKQQAKARQRLVRAQQQALKKITPWQTPFSRDEIADLLPLCQAIEGAWFRFFLPKFWQLRQLMQARYDFSAHPVAPTWQRILETLESAYQADENLQEADDQFGADYIAGSAETLLARLKSLHANRKRLSPGAQALQSHILAEPENHQIVAELLAVQPQFEALEASLAQLVHYCPTQSMAGIPQHLNELESGLVLLPDLVPELSAFAQCEPPIYQLASQLPWTADQIEAAVLRQALNDIYRQHREALKMTARGLTTGLQQLKEETRQLYDLNASVIVKGVQHQFTQKVTRASLPASQLNLQEKAWKKQYLRGRKVLEHEFGKVMRYKSIRALSSGESGEVLGDIKPIWLMSPLSVSETLPLDPAAFDMVIFDEASQITLEEAVPALFRAKQAIIVGDEQQLPPSRFFGTRYAEEETELADAPLATAALNADSFLAHAAQTLKSTLLGWHYRSHSEALINFSNAAFYQRQLLTIPDAHLAQAQSPIRIKSPEEPVNSHLATERAISFHYLPQGVYENRRNHDEATYICQLVDDLLATQPALSVGIVAFSEAQQDEIEQALHQHGSKNPVFRTRLEAATEREEAGQFVGLFVKNLENVQGDERDVIILSICYGYDKNRKMRMNFGPINQAGGEKRLNVVFSRAKQHMAVVSSIQHTAITNEYNDGANCFKRYLRYAAACSQGDLTTAAQVLAECCPDQGTTPNIDQSQDPVVQGITDWLRQEGYQVDPQVGASRFRCDLAVRGEKKYQLAILIDTTHHYAEKDLLEQYVQRPAVLTAFGWKVMRVRAKDWLEERDAVKRRILKQL